AIYQKLVPGYYTSKIATYPTSYVKGTGGVTRSQHKNGTALVPVTGTFLIKSPTSFDLAKPSIAYDFNWMLNRDANAYHGRDDIHEITNATSGISRPVWESGYPILKGKLFAVTTSIDPGFDIPIEEDPDGEPNVDGIYFKVEICGIKQLETTITLGDFYAGSPSTTGIPLADDFYVFDFNVSLAAFQGSKPDVTFTIESLGNFSRKALYLASIEVTDSENGTRADAQQWQISREFEKHANQPLISGTYNDLPIGTSSLGGYRYWQWLASQGRIERYQDAVSLSVNIDGGLTARPTTDMQVVDFSADIDKDEDLDTFKAIKMWHEDEGIDDDVNWCTTSITLADLFTSVPYTSYASFVNMMQGDHCLYDGLQFTPCTMFPSRTIWDSVRHADFRNGSAFTENFDSIYMKPDASGSPGAVILEYSDVYIPYRASIIGKLGLAGYAVSGCTVQYSIMIRDVDSAAILAAWNIASVTSTVSQQFITFTNDVLVSEALLRPFVGRNVAVMLKVTCTAGNMSQARAYWCDVQLVAWENTVIIPAGVPTALATALWSSNFLSFFTTNAVTNMAINPANGFSVTISDAETGASRNDIAGGIRQALNARDYSRVLPDGYTFPDVRYAFHEITSLAGTVVEDTAGNPASTYMFAGNSSSAFIQLKFNEWYLDRVQTIIKNPVYRVGYFQVHDEGSQLSRFTRRLRAVIMPWSWDQFSNYLELDARGRGTVSMDTTLSRSLNVSTTDDVQHEISVSYRYHADPHDLVVTNWGRIFEVMTPAEATASGLIPSVWKKAVQRSEHSHRPSKRTTYLSEFDQRIDEICLKTLWDVANWRSSTDPDKKAIVNYDPIYDDGMMYVITDPNRTRVGSNPYVAEAMFDFNSSSPAWKQLCGCTSSGISFNTFSHLGFEFITNDTANAKDISVTLGVRQGTTVTEMTLSPVATFQEGNPVAKGHYPLSINSTANQDLAWIKFTFTFDNKTLLPDHPVAFSLRGLYFTNVESRAELSINGGARVLKLPLDPLDGGSGWSEHSFTEAEILGGSSTLALSSMRLGITSLASDDGLLDVQGISIASEFEGNATTEDDDERTVLHSWSFNSQANELLDISRKLGIPGVQAPPTPWVATGGSAAYIASKIDPAVYKQSIDLDLSGDYDYSMQIMSKKGNPVFHVAANGSIILEESCANTVMDVDGDGDGIWELELSTSAMQSTIIQDEVAASFKKDISEKRLDENDDGAFETIQTDYRQITSETIPVWDLITWNSTDWEQHASWDFDASEWTYGYVDGQDNNGDGMLELETESIDLFTWDSLYGMFRTYETHTTTRRAWVVDEGDPANQTDDTARLNVTITRTNDLVENRTFLLQGADGYVGFTLGVIVQDNVTVLVDNRIDVPDACRLDENEGCIYWADLDGNFVFETGFVFTHITKEWGPPCAIGFFFDANMDQRL
nr:hypothetical protein [Candidatus Sigynarchaeota archaeon]